MEAPARLDADELATYHATGQATPRWRLPDSMLTRMRASLDRLLQTRPDFIGLPHIPWQGPSGAEIAREFFDYVTAPALLDTVEQVIGADIILWASSVFCKPAATGLEVPWHQDDQYWPIRPRATMSRSKTAVCA